MDEVKFFECGLPQILLVSFFNTLSIYTCKFSNKCHSQTANSWSRDSQCQEMFLLPKEHQQLKTQESDIQIATESDTHVDIYMYN